MDDALFVCREDDAYVRDRVRWVVRLSNGETIYQDDDRPDVSPPSAWIRLHIYCQRNNCYIKKMLLQFRTHIIEILPHDAPGYFFVKQAFGVWGERESYHAFIAGVLDPRAEGDVVQVTRYKVPELIELGSEERPVDRHSPSLIRRPG